MPGIIDSAPDCIRTLDGAVEGDADDFILQEAFAQCQEAGGAIMTFGPGTVFGADGSAATTEYYVLTWIGIIFMVCVLVGWIVYENRRLIGHVARLSMPKGEGPPPKGARPKGTT